MKTATQTKADKYETEIVKQMIAARRIAADVFGASPPTEAVHEVFDYLAVADEEDFLVDLKRVVGYAQEIYATPAPTSEQVFGLFERIFDDSDE